MLKTFEYRLYPNKEQQILFAKHFGCSRFIYNYFLNKKVQLYIQENKTLSCFECTHLITEMRNTEEYKWLKEVNSQSLYQVDINLDKAFANLFRSKSTEYKQKALNRKEKDVNYKLTFLDKKGFPEYKSKKGNRQTFACPQHVKVDFENNRVKLPKIKKPIKCIFSRTFEGKIKTCTIKKTPTNKYFISMLVDIPNIEPLQKSKIQENTTIGIDLGIKEFAIFSDGRKIENPKYLRNQLKRLKVLQKRLLRKQKGSNNRNKQRLKVALIHERISNKRKDFLHKLTYKLTHENQVNTICLEDLNVRSMMRNHKLAQSVSDVSWYNFNLLLEYKAEWYGKNILRIGRFDPSSKLCHVCGYKNTELTLNIREWECPICKAHHDRDVNAAINIKKFALYPQNLIYTGQGLPVEPVELPPKDRTKKHVEHVRKQESLCFS